MSGCKIIYLVSTLKPSGPTNVLFNIIKHLPDEFDVEVCTVSGHHSSLYESKFREIGVKVLNFNWLHLTPLLAYLRNNPVNGTIFHSHGIKSDLVLSFLGRRYNTFSTMHNYPSVDYVLQYGKLLGFIMSMLTFVAYRRFKVIVPCSYSIFEFYRFKTISSKMYVIQNGIDLDAWGSTATSEGEFIDSFCSSISVYNKKFLYLGAVIKRKNVDFVLDAFVKSPVKGACFIVVGDGDELNFIKSKYSKYENIIFAGSTSSPKEYYSLADFYVSGSESEGLPNAVLESRCMGLSTILSDIPPHRECGGDNSYYFRLGDCDCLSDMFLRARKHVDFKFEFEFSSSYMSEKYKDKYLEIINDCK